MAKKRVSTKTASRPDAAPPEAPPVAATPPETQDRFPVVGIGASAGGLEALTHLFKVLPASTGMAFVVVQHLDPNHESLLVDLLAKATSMSVEQVQDGASLFPNRIYVIPPNTEMVIQGAKLRLLSRSPVRGRHMPIDAFFRSMADDLAARAIGVILSGTSTDGAVGIEAIKGEGGITFAQDEASAKYDGMPRAAAATGCVDFVLPPDGISRELTRLASHPYVHTMLDAAERDSAAALPGVPERPLNRIFALLRNTTAVDFSLYKHTTIRRRISRRMALHKIEKLNDYVHFLEQERGEIEALYRELLIKVTGFFRDPEMFQFLKQKVFPQMVGRTRVEAPIRIWVPGCATGEEAYSLAIVLLEYLGDHSLNCPIQIFATDLSDEAIEKARSGIYMENISQDVSADRLGRFFLKHNGGYQVSESVRDLCVFARQNLAKDPPFSRLDLISCRNVLIYLEATLQKRIIPMFHYALAPVGFLLLGSSETIGGYTDLFDQPDKHHKVYSKHHMVNPRRMEFEPGAFTSGPGQPAAAKPSPPDGQVPLDLQKEADRVVLASFAPAGVVVNDELEVVQFRGRTSKFLELAPGKASLNLLKMLHEGLLLEVRNAIQKARRTGESVRKTNIPGKRDHGFHEVDLDVIPLQAAARGRHFLVLFRASAATPPPKGPHPKSDRQVDQFKQELTATRQYLQSIIEEQEATNEELQSANEEILSSNEELQSINEELETAKEELQSTNEELTTVNEELQNRNSELSQINDDLNNLLASANMAIVMLGSDLRIRRFTPLAGRILNMIPTDVGRPITDLRPSLSLPNLARSISEVLDDLIIKEQDVTDRDGRWFSLTIRPYRTSDHRIDGAVLTLVDFESMKRVARTAKPEQPHNSG